MTTEQTTATKTPSTMEELLSTGSAAKIPVVGDIIEGRVISVARNEVYIDIDGLTTGVVRGREVIDESGEYASLKPGDVVSATVIDLENEKGEIELSFRLAGHQKAWEQLVTLMTAGNVVDAQIIEANRGGLMIKLGHVEGFLPVSQLTVEHYPRVEGGEKDKILERLKAYMGQSFKVRVIDVDENDNKLIVSEKAAYEDAQKEKLKKYAVGTTVEGKVTGVVDFGAFVEFDEGLEGLVHISEIAWQRIDNPRDYLKVGQTVQAKIIGIDQSKISLSMKQLLDDPWKRAVDRYRVGQTVTGKVLKLNPFGAFVELDADIHGLAHISELSAKIIKHPSDVLKPGDTRDFKILTIEPDNHRLGLSIKALEAPAGQDADVQAVSGGSTESTDKAV